MKQALFGGFLVVALGVVVACSSSSGGSAAGCDSSKCGSGNQCIDDGSGSGPSCHLVCTQQSQCPFGYYCNDGSLPAANGGPGQPANWCVKNTGTFASTQQTDWGASCQPSGGESKNAACDSGNGFACFAVSPTDANAFCTQLGCAQDSDCPGGWWCATVDEAPNADTRLRSFWNTRSVCRPRQYCAPCQLDHDCPVDASGSAQHCVQDSQGNGFCSPQCSNDSQCALDATCVSTYPVCLPAQGASCLSDEDCPVTNTPSGEAYQHCYAGSCTPECGSDSDCTGSGQSCGNLNACQPRAGVCVGQGNLCDPCRSDADCSNNGGICIYADYSTERYCSFPTKGTCPSVAEQGVTVNAPKAGMCPSVPSNAPAADKKLGGLGCSFTNTQLATENQCLTFTSISDGNGGETQVPGCWTANR